MENKESKKCAVCHQIKPAQYFPDTAQEQSPQEYICFTCQAAITQSGSAEGSSGGGKKYQHNRDAKHIHYAIELENALHKEQESHSAKKQNKNIFQTLQARENDLKTQMAQREWLEQREEASKTPEKKDEPDPAISSDAQTRRRKIVHLFSVTRLLARNHIAANLLKAAQKNFTIFSSTKEKQTTNQKKALDKTETNKKLAADSSTLFAHPSLKEPAEEKAERLAKIIQKAQKIFHQ